MWRFEEDVSWKKIRFVLKIGFEKSWIEFAKRLGAYGLRYI